VTWFAVTRERGPAWDASRSMTDQADWPAHAAFMDALVEVGLIYMGGPVGDSGRVLHIVQASGEDEIRARLAADPWEPLGLLVTTQVLPWDVRLSRREG
jgi:uncharacterized protein YciI